MSDFETQGHLLESRFGNFGDGEIVNDLQEQQCSKFLKNPVVLIRDLSYKKLK